MFIYAKELKTLFSVTAHFYNLKLRDDAIINCRNTLEIKRKETNEKIPDIVVIMMNPGSSKPMHDDYQPKTYSFKKFTQLKTFELVPTKPDNAQYQIMRLMELFKWDFVRILNLSDLRNGNSRKFRDEYLRIKEIESEDFHCITHEDRMQELTSLLESKSKKILAAWGRIPELKESATKIIDLNREIIGIKNGEFNFRHASPHLKDQKLEWLTEISKIISSS